jgi:hypothetical protein
VLQLYSPEEIIVNIPFAKLALPAAPTTPISVSCHPDGGAVCIVKPDPLLAAPFTVTTTFPVVAPVGTGTTMLVALQLVGVPVVPLKLTVLVP